jgi:hypothetical protein
MWANTETADSKTVPLRLDVSHLLHESQADLRLAHDLAVVRFESAGNDSKECCLSGAVAAYESNFFVGIQLEAGVLEDVLLPKLLPM